MKTEILDAGPQSFANLLMLGAKLRPDTNRTVCVRLLRGLRVKLLDLANGIGSAIGLKSDAEPAVVERRREGRRPTNGHKVILRQRKALGILHLKNLSSKGGCGLTDMPLAVGSQIFVELRKPHFFAAEVRWVRSLSIGLEFFRPIRTDMFGKLDELPAPAPAVPEKQS